MKVKRDKKVQRHIGFFEKNFGFRTPYQVLVDGTFANGALIVSPKIIKIITYFLYK
jgi:U3 small nucleolar RNA-associated protein 23